MRSGQLRERLDIERPVETRGVGGGVSVSYATAQAGTPARVEHLRGRQLFEAASVRPQASVQVTVRYVPWLTVGHRFRAADGLVLNIAHIQPDERRSQMVCLCEQAMA